MEKNYKIRFHPKAIVEFIDQGNWYKVRSINVYYNFLIEFEQSILRIQDNPNIFQIVYKEKRKVSLSKFPISIVYSIHENQVLILSVFHHSRNPKIWKRRSK